MMGRNTSNPVFLHGEGTTLDVHSFAVTVHESATGSFGLRYVLLGIGKKLPHMIV